MTYTISINTTRLTKLLYCLNDYSFVWVHSMLTGTYNFYFTANSITCTFQIPQAHTLVVEVNCVKIKNSEFSRKLDSGSLKIDTL
mmetsp:Transcript_20959/g.29416  ORF Transcript_20959/g.29416 Transcript_20959/m.29416 type:complete len:85 (-) Transcript_20959:310-564(-)